MQNSNTIRNFRSSLAPAAPFFFLLLIVLSSCKTSHQRVMESNDYSLKQEYAEKYMAEERYSLAKPLLNDLIRYYRGTERVVPLYFMFAEAHFASDNFMVASHYFKTLADNFPNHELSEEALFMHAYSIYQLSPRPSLDQSHTRQALQGFQLFVNRYPRSDLVDRSHAYMDELRRKLEIKAINNAKLYYRIGDYRAAVWALRSVLTRYPATERREELEFLILKSSYLLAKNSVADMQPERYRETIEFYNRFQERHSDSHRLDEAKDMYDTARAFFE